MALFFNEEEVLQKSKAWSEIVEIFPQQEQYEDMKILDIPSDRDDGISDDCSPNQSVVVNNNNDNECKALLKVDSFEGETSSDDNIDEFANRTAIPMVNEQKKKWKECGMLDVLETFDLDKITKVVEKIKHEKSQSQSSSIDEHIVHIEEHHHRQIHVESDNESFHSIDTANYIRSNQKKKSARCATTTIKKFSYFKGSKRQLARKFGLENLDEIFSDKVSKNKVPMLPQRSLKQVLGSEPPKVSPYEPKSVPLPERRRKSRQMKRRSDISKCSISSSSSSSSRAPVRPLKPRYRKSRKTNSPEAFNKFKNELKKPQIKPAPPAKRRVRYKADPINLISTEDEGSPKRQLQLPRTIQNGSSSNETCFSGASILNSTALNTANQSSRKSLTEKEREEDSVTLVPESLPSPAKPRTVLAINLKPLKVKLQRNKIKTPEPETVRQTETEYSGASILNSTALNTANQSSTKSLTEHIKKCLITPIKKISKEREEDSVTLVPESLPSPAKPRTVLAINLKPLKVKLQRNKIKTPEPETVRQTETRAPESKAEQKVKESTNVPEPIAEIPRVVAENENKVLLHSPNNIEAHKDAVCAKKFFLTKEYFLEKVGKKNSRRFIKLNLKKFPFKFNCNSRVYFKVYDESEAEESASSDEDVVSMFGREGELIVEDCE